MGACEETLGRMEACASTIGRLLLLALMLIVTADVFSRYVIGSPFAWTYDLVSLYVMPAIFFLILSESFREDAQVRVDILRERLPPGVRAWADAVGNLGALIVFAAIAYAAFRRGSVAFVQGDVVAGPIPWPMWPSIMIVPVGAVMLVARLALSTIAGFRGDVADGDAAAAVPGAPAGGGVE